MISDIEAAREAADRLPTDLAELMAKKAEVERTALTMSKFLASTNAAERAETAQLADIESRRASVDDVIKKSEEALREATGVDLAAAFEKRRESLSRAVLLWTVGLIGALVAGVFIGAERVSALRQVLVPSNSASVIWANVAIALLGIAGPIWFAWVSTKQIWSAFRLSEDYAFKASVSRAYEGYIKEAVDIDPELRGRLFTSTLSRLEEAPIRLMDNKSHGSPLQELLDDPAIRQTLETIPDIKKKILALIGGQPSVDPISIAPRSGHLEVVANEPEAKL